MKVRLSIDVDGADRYLIAQHFSRVELGPPRSRATRAQVRRFVELALNTALRDQAEGCRGRSRAVVRRLRTGTALTQREILAPPDGHQPTLW